MVNLSGAKSLIKCLKLENVEHVFGLPGGANLPIYDALVDSDIRHILVRHEQIAAHMADGYARALRKPGVCMATSGPGATNLVTGLATAHLDSSPVVAITGQVPTDYIGKDAFQETDAVGVLIPVTKYCVMPTTAAEVPYCVKKLFHLSNTGRPGPVLLDMPKDVQQETIDFDYPKKIQLRGYEALVNPDSRLVNKAANLLLSAKKPMILAGGGVTICNSFKALQNLAEFLMAPVVTTFKGKGAFPENHPLALGPIGMHGHIEANKMILEADVLLAIGCRFSDRSVGRWDTFGNNMKIIHIDVDKSELGKNKRPTVGIHGDLNITLNKLLPILMKKSIVKNNPWMARLKSLKNQYKDTSSYDDDTVNPRSVLKELRKAIPNNTIITTDVGQHQMWSSLYFDIYSPGTFFTSTGLGTMGFGFPAALGAKVGKPNLPSICISGDGSFNMVEQALATAVLDNIPAIVVILNNGSLGMVAQWQRVFYNKRYLGVNLQNSPDFVKIAQAYGAEGIRVQSLPEFNKAVKNALKSEVATVIDVPIDPEADVFPFVAPGTSLADMILPS